MCTVGLLGARAYLFVCARWVLCMPVIVPVCVCIMLFICFIILCEISNKFTLSPALACLSAGQ